MIVPWIHNAYGVAIYAIVYKIYNGWILWLHGANKATEEFGFAV